MPRLPEPRRLRGCHPVQLQLPERAHLLVPNGTRNTMAHELGHIPELEHHTNQTHLMYGSNYAEDPFRTRGCIVPELLPDGFIGEQNTTDRYWELSFPLNETNDAPGELRGDMGMVICKKLDKMRTDLPPVARTVIQIIVQVPVRSCRLPDPTCIYYADHRLGAARPGCASSRRCVPVSYCDAC